MIRTEWLHSKGVMSTQKIDVLCDGDKCEAIHEWAHGYTTGNGVCVAKPSGWTERLQGRVLKTYCPCCSAT